MTDIFRLPLEMSYAFSSSATGTSSLPYFQTLERASYRAFIKSNMYASILRSIYLILKFCFDYINSLLEYLSSILQ